MTTTTMITSPSTAQDFEAAASVWAMLARSRAADAKPDAEPKPLETVPEPDVIRQLIELLACNGLLTAQEASHLLNALTTGTFTVLPEVLHPSGLYAVFSAKLALMEGTADSVGDTFLQILHVIEEALHIGHLAHDLWSAITHLWG
jgi:hypothetical protein